MAENETIDIDQQQWLIVPAELQDGLTETPLGRQQLRAWSLVLQARQIPWRSQRRRNGWQLLVPVAEYPRACQELRQYEELNRNWPPPPPTLPPEQENTQTTIWILVALGLFHIITQEVHVLGNRPIDWYNLGSADAGKILQGEWWRLVTALTLHSGGIHLAGNIVVGGIFINRLCRELGSGLGWSLVLLTGILGNLANALVQSPDHRSIGASTAVFGAVGLLGAMNMLRYRKNLRNRWPLPVAGALGLLALLGVGGENTDIGAHLFGFGFGLVIGAGFGWLLSRSSRITSSSNHMLAAATTALIFLAWGIALTSL